VTASRRDLLLGGAHLAVLWAFAFAQPLFDLLANEPEFFVARGNERADILAFAFGVVLLPPLAMLVLEWVALRVSTTLRTALHLTLIGVLSAALALQFLDELIAAGAGLLIALAAAIGALAALAYGATRFLPAALSVLSPTPAVFLALFLLFSPVSELVLPQGEVEAPESVEVGSDAPVVVVIFDELPLTSLLDARGRIDAARYPAFAALARRSVWYRNATSVEWFTTRAVPAIVTGRRPPEGALPTARDQPRNLFTLFGGELELNVSETSTRLCPEALCPGGPLDQPFEERMDELFSDLSLVSAHLLLPQSLRDRLPPVDQTFGDFAGEELGEVEEGGPGLDISDEGPGASFLDWAGSIEATPAIFNFHHSKLPHSPFNRLPSGVTYPEPSVDLLPERWSEERSPGEQVLQQHLLQVGYADTLLGRLIARLRELGIWDEALVAVTADHGISFEPGALSRKPSPRNVADIAGVPLFVKAPGQTRARVERRHVCTTELLAILGLLLEVEGGIDVEPCPLSEVDVAGTSVPLEDFRRDEVRTLRRLTALLGPAQDWSAVYRIGSHRDLLGAGAHRVRRAPETDASASLVDPSRYESVDPDGLTVPSVIEGELEGVEPGEELAIAVEGRIAAMTRAFEAVGVVRFVALVPPRTFVEGANRIEVFRVAGSGGRADGGSRRVRLEPLGD
jgi:hypothetical protein